VLSLAFFLIFLSLNAAAVPKLFIASPTDKMQTLSTRAAIIGAAPGAKEVDLNGTKVDLSGGKFNAVALLKPGKNVVLVKAVFPGGAKLTKKIRVLRIVACDDIEKLFKGKQHWAKQQVLTLLTLGVIEGYPNNMFEPGKPLERAEFATWLARAKQLKRFQPKEDVFFDVPKEHWRAPYIKAVVDAGYMRGLTGDRFAPNDEISRGDAVAAVARASKLTPLKLYSGPFNDVLPSSKDGPYIFSAYNKGWIVGVPGKVRRFEPERDMTRGEVAVLLSRLSDIKELRASLYDFAKGYTSYQFCGIGTRPVIVKVDAKPVNLEADGKTPVKLTAKVTDEQGMSDISFVWADITSLGGPNNAKMNLSRNGEYELSFIMTTETVPGEKIIPISALDKSGLKSDISNAKIVVTKGKQ
jgi:Glucodextranase, domain B/S-layer homology domain